MERRAFLLEEVQRRGAANCLRIIDEISLAICQSWRRPVSLLILNDAFRYDPARQNYQSWCPHLLSDATVIFLRDVQDSGVSAVIDELTAAGELTLVEKTGNADIFRYTLQAPVDHQTTIGVLPSPATSSDTREFPSDPSWLELTTEVYYGGRGEYLYWPIAKCASTTIKTLLLELEGLPHDLEIWKRHSKRLNKFPSLAHLPTQQAMGILRGQTPTFKFTVVRNPFSRLASAYFDKVLRRDRYVRRLLREHASRHRQPMAEEIGFEEFVELVSTQDVADMDPHWRPQYVEGHFAYISYDYVGRAETLQNDLTYILERIRAPEAIISKVVLRENASGSTLDIWSGVSELVRRKFTSAYEIDFDTFRYSRRLSAI